MYRAKTEKFIGINQAELARITGLAHPTVNRIIRNKQSCSKCAAFCIVKSIDKDAEIDDYFVRKDK